MPISAKKTNDSLPNDRFFFSSRVSNGGKLHKSFQYVVTLNDMLFKNQLKIPSSLGKYTC